MEKDTKELTKEDLLNPDFIPSIFENYKDPQEREEVLTEIMEIGKTYKVGGKLKDAIGRCTQAEQSIAGQVFNFLIFNKDSWNSATNSTSDLSSTTSSSFLSVSALELFTSSTNIP